MEAHRSGVETVIFSREPPARGTDVLVLPSLTNFRCLVCDVRRIAPHRSFGTRDDKRRRGWGEKGRFMRTDRPGRGGLTTAILVGIAAGVAMAAIAMVTTASARRFGPHGNQVGWQDDQGEDDNGGIACCIPEDDGEVECENTSPQECADEGGTPAGGSAGGCFPDACGPGTGEDEDQGDNDQGDDNG